MPSVAATLRQYPSHPAATIKHTVNGSPLRPVLNADHTPHCPRRRSSLPAHQRALDSGSFLHYSSESMRSSTQIRRYCATALSGRHRDGSSQIPVLQGTTTPTPRHALPRKIAQGVFFVDPTSGDRDAALSTRTLVDLEITHAVVARGSDLSRLSKNGMKALFVGSHDPLSRVVAWMRAVRRLGACIIIVSDVAAAAGYLVVELSLTPRSAWLRIARGIPPAGDLVLAKLCALALTHSAKDEVASRSADGELAGGHGGSERCVAPHSCRSLRGGPRGESSLKHVFISSL